MKIAAIAKSALSAHKQRVETAANNLVNSHNAGSNETAFHPSRTELVPRKDGGVTARTSLISPGSISVFNPDHPQADSDGMVNAPDVSVISELVEIKMASASYKASLKLLQTADDMASELLETGKDQGKR